MQCAPRRSGRPEVPIRLNRVGAVGIKKLVEVERGKGRPIVLVANFDVFVDLPHSMKGANLSRNFEVIDDIIERSTSKPVKKIENLCVEWRRCCSIDTNTRRRRKLE